MSLGPLSLRNVAVAVMASTACATALAQKPVTYVDADSLGPILTPGEQTDRSTGNTAQLFGAGFDDWVVRDNGVGGDVYQFMSSNGVDPTELVTTITGLTPGVEYNFYAFFWEGAGGTGNWYLDASLQGPGAADSAFTNYSVADLNNATGPVYEAAELPFSNYDDINTTNEYVASNPGVFYTNDLNPGFSNDQTRTNGVPSDLDLLSARVGTAVAPGSGQIDIYIRNLTAGNRVWYDGVGYQEAGGVTGDTNGDGQVNIADYNEIASRIGGPAVTPGSLGDVFGDGVIDLKDFSVWQQNRTDGATSAVPEPAALLVAGLAVVGAATRSRRAG
ncbi:dockerin type I domain-containing protein [Botrimarina mediterranea]|uniref:Ice-binding protein C-terminal domain-containing protein n=1 Tax=Botrimarina mediterranea TaxID=2528022 RepID=A0A518K2V6_9BACT|nr:dockerin type I domain-containing protein [Botrimarina mediterranea]QDV72109.1 hypothetical protein Spa11_02800 [Botrimarina mediterranea]QDV76651.1 hypothetical protein K2D_02310 [Planctomycetes bacterium K2D]